MGEEKRRQSVISALASLSPRVATVRKGLAFIVGLGLESRMQQMSCTPASCTTRIGRMRHARSLLANGSEWEACPRLESP